MELYKKHVEEDGIFHLGSKPYSVIVDIDEKGNITVETDTELIDAYEEKDDHGDDDKEDKEKKNADLKKSIYIIPSSTRIDEKPMGEL
jgi:hypothetical protein